MVKIWSVSSQLSHKISVTGYPPNSSQPIVNLEKVKKNISVIYYLSIGEQWSIGSLEK